MIMQSANDNANKLSLFIMQKIVIDCFDWKCYGGPINVVENVWLYNSRICTQQIKAKLHVIKTAASEAN